MVKSFSTSMMRSVSARRTLSPTVGPNICAYAARFILCGIFDVLADRNWSSVRELRQRSHHRLVEAISQACAAVRDKRNFTGLSRLEPHRRSRWNVQPTTKGGFSVESKSCVRLGKMVVTADLDRSVACVRDFERNCRSVLVQNDLARCWKNLAGYHPVSP